MRTKTGTVVSSKNDKTIVVQVDTYRTHSKYKKRYRVSTKFHAHDPENKHQEGDKVTIYETRPLSKMKRWTTVEPRAVKKATAKAEAPVAPQKETPKEEIPKEQ